MIALFTDFGADDIYVAQLKAALLQHAPAGTPIIDLLHSVPNFDARAGARSRLLTASGRATSLPEDAMTYSPARR